MSDQISKQDQLPQQPMMDVEVAKTRLLTKEKIYEILLLKQPTPNDYMASKLRELSRRLEEALFRTASSKEEYMNMESLELRLQGLIRLRRTPQTNNPPQPRQSMNTPAPVGTTIPTSGMQQQNNLNSDVTVSSAVDQSDMITQGMKGLMANSNGSFSSVHGGSLRGADGSLSNGNQQALSSFSMNSDGNNVMDGPQMISTPRVSGNTNQAVDSSDTTSSGGVSSSSVDSSVVSQSMSQNHVSRGH